MFDIDCLVVNGIKKHSNKRLGMGLNGGKKMSDRAAAVLATGMYYAAFFIMCGLIVFAIETRGGC